MALWFPSGNATSTPLASTFSLDTAEVFYLTFWMYTGPSQSARIFSLWPGNETGTFMVERDATTIIGHGHATGDFETYYTAFCYLRDCLAYRSCVASGLVNNSWIFCVLKVEVTYRNSKWDYVRKGAWDGDEGPYGSGIETDVTLLDLGGSLLGSNSEDYNSGIFVNPNWYAGGQCNTINLEAFDLWKLKEPITHLHTGGLGAAAIFEGAICEVAIWDAEPALTAGFMGVPKPFMPLLDTTNLLAYWPLINSMIPAYVDTNKNSYATMTGTLAGSAYFGAHPFPIEQGVWDAGYGTVVEKAVPIYVESMISTIIHGRERGITGPQRQSAVYTSNSKRVVGPDKLEVIHTGLEKRVLPPDRRSVY